MVALYLSVLYFCAHVRLYRKDTTITRLVVERRRQSVMRMMMMINWNAQCVESQLLVPPTSHLHSFPLAHTHTHTHSVWISMMMANNIASCRMYDCLSINIIDVSSNAHSPTIITTQTCKQYCGPTWFIICINSTHTNQMTSWSL